MIGVPAVAVTSVVKAMFSLDAVYVLTGLVLWVFATMTIRDRGNPRRFGSAWRCSH